MRTLTLLRHADADPGDAATRDFDRPLTPAGRLEARAIGGEMRRLGLSFDVILASPATRVRQTLAEAASGYEGALEAIEDERIYLAALETLMGLVRSTGDDKRSLLLVGHNPGMAHLLAALGGEAAGALSYPTGALAEISLPVERWKDAECGTLARFIGPGELGR